jgi:hypothetical protein
MQMHTPTISFSLYLAGLAVLVCGGCGRLAPRAATPLGGHRPATEADILSDVARTDDDAEFIPLLSQEALKHWRQCGPGQFVVKNGVATGEGGMGLWWYSVRQFDNFILRGQFMQEQEIADSGVFLRFPDPGNDPWEAVHKGHEMEIGDPEPDDPTWRTGSIYPFCASTKANTKSIGQWNRYEIVCAGHLYSVRINDEEVLRWADPNQRTLKGYVGLQNYPDNKTVHHRNLRIKPLP